MLCSVVREQYGYRVSNGFRSCSTGGLGVVSLGCSLEVELELLVKFFESLGMNSLSENCQQSLALGVCDCD